MFLPHAVSCLAHALSTHCPHGLLPNAGAEAAGAALADALAAGALLLDDAPLPVGSLEAVAGALEPPSSEELSAAGDSAAFFPPPHASQASGRTANERREATGKRMGPVDSTSACAGASTECYDGRMPPRTRPTSWWLATLRKRRVRMDAEKLDLSRPPDFGSPEERAAAIAFFNAAYRAEESGLRQAHELAGEVAAHDPDLAECLTLYGDEEGWHRRLLTEFLAWLGGDVKPMGPTTRTFYRLYARAKRMESIVLVNLMFETIGSTTYRIALRRAEHPVVRQMLTILTRDESFHVPLNVHFLRQAVARAPADARPRLRAIYHATYVALVASTIASRRRAYAFDRIPTRTLAGAYAEQLARLFVEESDLGLEPSTALLRAFGLKRERLTGGEPSAVSIDAAIAAADRETTVVTAL